MKSWMNRFSHVTPKYLFNRIKVFIRERLYPDRPWLVGESVDFLDSWIRSSDKVLEWGSGRSTLWFMKRCDHITSIEHDANWGSRVKGQIHSSDSAKISYHLEPVLDGDAEARYISVARLLPNQSVDVCLVDGVLRDECALVAVDKLKSGGLLIIDNVNWYLPVPSLVRSPSSRTVADGFASIHWAKFSELTAHWRCFWVSDGVSDTAIWFKP